jgi:hypothetical protein
VCEQIGFKPLWIISARLWLRLRRPSLKCGPSLAAGSFPANQVLANPVLELRDSNGTLLIANNDWQDNPAQAAELIADGLAPTNALESGITATLPPGLYTALLAGLNNGTGIGLVEVYDLGP